MELKNTAVFCRGLIRAAASQPASSPVERAAWSSAAAEPDLAGGASAEPSSASRGSRQACPQRHKRHRTSLCRLCAQRFLRFCHMEGVWEAAGEQRPVLVAVLCCVAALAVPLVWRVFAWLPTSSQQPQAEQPAPQPEPAAVPAPAGRRRRRKPKGTSAAAGGQPPPQAAAPALPCAGILMSARSWSEESRSSRHRPVYVVHTQPRSLSVSVV
jgi:hypothetical protein